MNGGGAAALSVGGHLEARTGLDKPPGIVVLFRDTRREETSTMTPLDRLIIYSVAINVAWLAWLSAFTWFVVLPQVKRLREEPPSAPNTITLMMTLLTVWVILLAHVWMTLESLDPEAVGLMRDLITN